MEDKDYSYRPMVVNFRSIISEKWVSNILICMCVIQTFQYSSIWDISSNSVGNLGGLNCDN